MLAPWLGGACAPATVPPPASVRSLFAFWAGGACAIHPVIVPPQPGGPPSRKPLRLYLHGVEADDTEILEFVQLWLAWHENQYDF